MPDERAEVERLIGLSHFGSALAPHAKLLLLGGSSGVSMAAVTMVW